MTYFRLKVLSGEITGLPEEISEEDAMKAELEYRNELAGILEKGGRIEVNGYLYWKEE